MLPYQIVFGANFRLQSGLPITRTWADPPRRCCVRAAVTVNAEPRGSLELDWLPTLDLRAGRFFFGGGNRLELSLDVYNATNANTVFSVRTGTGLSTIRVDGDSANPPVQIQQFLSPTAVLAPRVLRFNMAYHFGR